MMETKENDKQPVANRRYKDTVFRMLFSKKENLLSLYNAVTGREYEDAEALQKIPAPKFMVFYNGTDEEEDRVELRLSSAYEHLSGEPDLELKVLMLNANEGHNKELMEHCKLLQEYARYVAKVREYTIQMDLNDAVECAIEACIKEGVLVDFLRENRSEVKMLSILEYDKEWEEKKLRKAEYEAGMMRMLEFFQNGGTIEQAKKLIDTARIEKNGETH